MHRLPICTTTGKENNKTSLFQKHLPSTKFLETLPDLHHRPKDAHRLRSLLLGEPNLRLKMIPLIRPVAYGDVPAPTVRKPSRLAKLLLQVIAQPVLHLEPKPSREETVSVDLTRQHHLKGVVLRRVRQVAGDGVGEDVLLAAAVVIDAQEGGAGDAVGSVDGAPFALVALVGRLAIDAKFVRMASVEESFVVSSSWKHRVFAAGKDVLGMAPAIAMGPREHRIVL